MNLKIFRKGAGFFPVFTPSVFLCATAFILMNVSQSPQWLKISPGKRSSGKNPKRSVFLSAAMHAVSRTNKNTLPCPDPAFWRRHQLLLKTP
jgi:hypothetical protein